MRSIRAGLLGWLGVGLLILFAVSGVLVYGVVVDRVEADLADELAAVASALAAGLELQIDPDHKVEIMRLGALAMPDPNRSDAARREALARFRTLAEDAIDVRFTLEPGALPAWTPGSEAARYAIYDNQRTLVVAHRMTEEEVFGSSDEGRLRPTGVPGIDEATLEDGTREWARVEYVSEVRFRDAGWNETWRQLIQGRPEGGPGATILVRRSTAGMERFLGRLRGGLILAGIGLALLVALTSWWVVGRGLRPVRALSEQVGALRPQSLGARIDEASLPHELKPIAHRLNEALERIEYAVERERQTAAHIAHELRTPVAELRSITEIAKKWPDEATLQAQAVKDSHEVALHMSRVIAALLKVARAGEGADALELTRLDVVPLVRAAWESLASTAAEREQTLEDALPEQLRVRTDADVAEAVVASLLKNAIQHAPAGSSVRIGADVRGGRAELTIANPAPDLTPDDVEHVAEAFWRKDAARTRSEEGGLGLTLAYELCRSAGIEIRPSLETQVFALTLVFPSAE